MASVTSSLRQRITKQFTSFYEMRGCLLEQIFDGVLGLLKHVLLAAALLAPALAYSASPGTNLSVQIVPAATPTPPPSPTPPPPPPPSPPPTGLTPPPGAQAAGFTTLEANYDFTGQTTAFYQTLSNWLDCAGASSPQFWTVANPVPCSAFSIINDGGTQVLDIQFQPSFGSQLGAGASSIDGTNTVNSNPPNPSYITYPLGMYYEVSMRLPQSTINACPGGTCLLADAWAWFGPNGGRTEWDFIEFYSNGAAGPACHTWDGSTCSGPPSVGYPGFTSYHTYGVLITSDGTNENACTYLDNSLVGCGGEVATGTPADATQRNYLRLDVGPQSTSGFGGVWPTSNMDAYIQWVRVWGCPGWQTGSCISSSVYNP